MDCLCPIYVKNPNPKPRDYAYHRVPCGKCEACLRKRQSDWYTRLRIEQDQHYYVCFVTLTYDEEHLPLGSNVSRYDVQCYHKRLRSMLNYPIKYFVVSEYGINTHRPHYHGIYYGLKPSDYGKLHDAWDNGFVCISDVSDARIRYVCGYVINKVFVPPGREPVFNLISKGLGKSYIHTHKDWHDAAPITVRSYVPYHGRKLSMPRYYKDRLYSPSQRKVYAQQLSDDAEQRLQEHIADMGYDEYKRQVVSRTRQYVDKVRKSQKTRKL